MGDSEVIFTIHTVAKLKNSDCRLIGDVAQWLGHIGL